MKTPVIAIVCPCYNEEETLQTSASRLDALLREMEDSALVAPGSLVLFVDDGSRDDTWPIIESLVSSGKRFAGLKLQRNAGQQNALMAGMEAVRDLADCVVTIDVDLQDDIRVIPEMVRKYTDGADVVLGVRRDRSSDSWLKRTTAQGFYRLLKGLGMKTVYNHADFRLLSRRALNQLLSFPERNLYLRGMVTSVGHRREYVYYDRLPRTAGETKYTLSKMFNLAADGITSFSIRPVRMVFSLGCIFLLVALGILVYVLVSYFTGNSTEGWSSIMLSIWFCSGVLLVALGIVGEYIGKIYSEVKQRPRFFVDTLLLPESKEK